MNGSVKWKSGMAFESQLQGFSFMIDADPEFGGQGLGPGPKGLTAVSLAGCTAMDVIAILRKMKVEPNIDSFEVTADGSLQDEHPKKITNIAVKYIFEGEKLPASVDKIKHAIQLSTENYCGVIATLKPSVEITYQLVINGQVID
ncbi:MAG: OsmC family protein [bacterium]|nr:OsmC family protein [bacterium]